MTLRAAIFDFDGLILDTETPEFRAWQEAYEEAEVTLTIDDWIGIVGTWDPSFDMLDDLRRRTAVELDSGRVKERWRERKAELIACERPLPGVVERLDEAAELDLLLGVASTSRRAWVTGHLERLGLLDRFDAIVGRDDVGGRAKPAPDVYLETVRRLGCKPNEAVAIEDSAHGVAAAATAGLFTIAVPNRITKHADLSAADLVIGSLADETLAALMEHVAHGRPGAEDVLPGT